MARMTEGPVTSAATVMYALLARILQKL